MRAGTQSAKYKVALRQTENRIWRRPSLYVVRPRGKLRLFVSSRPTSHLCAKAFVGAITVGQERGVAAQAFPLGSSEGGLKKTSA